jgi:hypothetical protein
MRKGGGDRCRRERRSTNRALWQRHSCLCSHRSLVTNASVVAGNADLFLRIEGPPSGALVRFAAKP